MSNAIRWYKSAEMDAPELNSPQPCKRGIHCNYMVKNDVDEWEPGCCRGVHPGEEGTGRRIFPARITEDGREQPACVRLTGRAGYYERRRLRLSWSQWCEREGIPFTPAPKDFEPVTLVSFSKRSEFKRSEFKRSEFKATDHSFAPQLDPRMMSRGFLGMPGGAEAARIAAGGATPKLTKNQRPACQPYEGMSCAYGGFGGCVYCTISCEELEAGLLGRPSTIDLSSGSAQQRFAVRGRGGECSPDCCCPTGLSCHDRTIPDENCEGGCCSPLLTAIVPNGDFESLD
jgi:hypothetical protein